MSYFQFVLGLETTGTEEVQNFKCFLSTIEKLFQEQHENNQITEERILEILDGKAISLSYTERKNATQFIVEEMHSD